MKIFYEVFDGRRRRVNKEDYQRAIVEDYRRRFPLTSVKKNKATFVYPYSIPSNPSELLDFKIKIEKSYKGLARISLEGCQFKFDEFEVLAQIGGRFIFNELSES